MVDGAGINSASGEGGRYESGGLGHHPSRSPGAVAHSSRPPVLNEPTHPQGPSLRVDFGSAPPDVPFRQEEERQQSVMELVGITDDRPGAPRRLIYRRRVEGCELSRVFGGAPASGPRPWTGRSSSGASSRKA